MQARSNNGTTTLKAACQSGDCDIVKCVTSVRKPAQAESKTWKSPQDMCLIFCLPRGAECGFEDWSGQHVHTRAPHAKLYIRTHQICAAPSM